MIINKVETVEKEVYSHCFCDVCGKEFAKSSLIFSFDSCVTSVSYTVYGGGQGSQSFPQFKQFCSCECMLSYVKNLRVGNININISYSEGLRFGEIIKALLEKE